MPLSPMVTDADRLWSLAQCPTWAVRGALEQPITDDEPRADPKKILNWDMFVADQIERFEKFFAHERKPAADWSRLWRKSWWPKADPAILHPRLVPRKPGTHPVFRRGGAKFNLALALGSPAEKRIWRKLGLAQFAPGDERIAKIVPRESTDFKMRAAGERE